MADIFLSYAKADRSAAAAVAAALHAHGWSVWFDDRLVAGESWDETIERELAAARSVVVLWSATSVKSRWVRNESRQAGDRLVPAALDAAKWPVEFDHLQVVSLACWSGDAGAPEFQRLVEGVARRLDQPPVKVQQTWVSRIRRSRRAILYAVGVILVAAAGTLAYREPWTRPRILLMDSPLPDVVYDRVAAAKGQTNATAIADILKDLRVDVIKESTDLEWHRERDIRRMNPNLIVIHGSAFYSQTNGSDNAGKLLSFLEFMNGADSRFLVYTRVPTDGLESALQSRIPGSKQFRFWQVPGGREATFSDPATRRKLLQIVTEMLGT